MNKAGIVNGKVARIIDAAKLGLFPPHIQAEFVDVPVGAEVSLGDLYNGTEFSKPTAPLPTQEEYEAGIQKMLDDGARLRNYDDVRSAVTYVGDKNAQFAAEALAYRDWRSNVWTYCYTQLAAVQAGQRTQPATVVELVTEVGVACPLVLP